MRSRMIGVVALLLVPAMPVDGQVRWERGDEGWCEEWGSAGSERFCDVLTATVTSSGSLAVDGGQNGGVQVEAWDRAEMRVRAKVWARADSEARAEALAREVGVRIDGGRIRAEGPGMGRRESWGVSYEVMVPGDTDLELTTHNGGISIGGVEGEIRFDALNGGVRLTDVAGDVRGKTTNGGLHVELDGRRWNGAGIDVETQNGGIHLAIPEDFSAELVTGTVNGRIVVDFPVTVRGRIGRQLRTTLGSGGPTVRAVTTNGGVRIVRR